MEKDREQLALEGLQFFSLTRLTRSTELRQSQELSADFVIANAADDVYLMNVGMVTTRNTAAI